MTSLLARHRLALLVLGAGLALRVVLAFVVFPGAGYAGDLGQSWQWAQALAANGPGSFYATVSSANYPPLYLYVLWLLGSIGAPDRIKLPPILADIGIAAIVYAVGRRTWAERVGLLAAALFLFLPVSWYDSALWGQVDAAGTLLVLAALVLLLDGWSEAALVLAVLAVLVLHEERDASTAPGGDYHALHDVRVGLPAGRATRAVRATATGREGLWMT
jgi:dolichyl-phosphate-mannose-protein mannosyltransferase